MIVLASAYPALAAVLLFAAGGKVRDVRGFAATIDGYRIMPRRLAAPAAVLVLAAEAGAALLLAVPATRRWGALVAAGLFTAFLLAMVSVLRRGLRVDCGCFGSSRRSGQVGAATVVRTGSLLLLAVMAAIAGPAGFRPAHLVLSAVFLGLIGSLTRFRRSVRVPVPDDPPRAGGPRPGARFALNGLAATDGDGGPTLYALVSPACGACTAMLPTFAAAAAKTRVVLVSAAEEQAVREHLTAHGIDLPLLIDPGVYDANDIPWPPYAVVTDAAGTVLSAGGADTPHRLDVLLTRAAASAARGL